MTDFGESPEEVESQKAEPSPGHLFLPQVGPTPSGVCALGSACSQAIMDELRGAAAGPGAPCARTLDRAVEAAFRTLLHKQIGDIAALFSSLMMLRIRLSLSDELVVGLLSGLQLLSLNAQCEGGP